MSPTESALILLIDDFPLCREALQRLLRERFPLARVVASSNSHEGAAAASVVARADVIVCSLATVPVGGAFERLVASSSARVVALDGRADEGVLRLVRAAGAKGYLPMTATAALIGAAMDVVAAGGSYFPGSETPETEVALPAMRALSPRQREVLMSVRLGRTNREIAASLGITVATVKLHVHAALKAIGARNRTEAAVLIDRVTAAPDATVT